MTKKDYELIQSVLIQEIENYKRWAGQAWESKQKQNQNHSTLNTLVQQCRRLADKLATQDQNFDRNRFLTGCGIDEEAFIHLKAPYWQ